MQINDVLHTASKYESLIDFVNDSPELKNYKGDVEECAKEKISSFNTSYEKFSKNLNEYEIEVNTHNKEVITNLAGIIDVAIDVFSIIKLQDKNTNQYKACFGILINTIKTIQEIYCLCSNGFSDGALARWRSLFENYITLKLIIEFDEQTSEMFLGYESVIKHKRINELNNFIKIENAEIFENEYNELIKIYTDKYDSYNGWLIKEFPNRNDRTFVKLAEHVGCTEWLFYYRMACDYLHTNAFSAFESTGKINGQIPMGPSLEGLELAIKLTITFTIYLLTRMVEKFVGKYFIGLFLMDYLLKILECLEITT